MWYFVFLAIVKHLFYKLVEEMRCIQSSNSDSNPDSNPDPNSDNTKQPLDQKINKKFGMDPKSPSLNISRLCEYLSIDPTNIGTRFNW